MTIVNIVLEESATIFDIHAFAADLETVDIAPYLPEPKNIHLLLCALCKLSWIELKL